MKRRRRGGLGSSAAEHEGRAENWRKIAEGSANRVHKHIVKGSDECPLAVKESAHMNMAYGRYLAEVEGATGSVPRSGVTGAVVGAAMSAIVRRCLR